MIIFDLIKSKTINLQCFLKQVGTKTKSYLPRFLRVESLIFSEQSLINEVNVKLDNEKTL